MLVLRAEAAHFVDLGVPKVRNDDDVFLDTLKLMREPYLDVQIADELEPRENPTIITQQVRKRDDDANRAPRHFLNRYAVRKDSPQFVLGYLGLLLDDGLLLEIYTDSGQFREETQYEEALVLVRAIRLHSKLGQILEVVEADVGHHSLNGVQRFGEDAILVRTPKMETVNRRLIYLLVHASADELEQLLVHSHLLVEDDRSPAANYQPLE